MKPPVTFGVLNRIFRDTGTEVIKTHKSGTVPENLDVVVFLDIVATPFCFLHL